MSSAPPVSFGALVLLSLAQPAAAQYMRPTTDIRPTTDASTRRHGKTNVAKLRHDNPRWTAEGTQLWACAEARGGISSSLSGSCCDASPRGTLRRLALLFQFRPAV